MSWEGILSDPAVLASLGAAAAASVYLYSMSPAPVPPPVDLKNQSVPSNNGSGSRVNAACKDGKLVERAFDETKTLYDTFRRGVGFSGEGPCLGSRTGPNEEYEYVTYNTALRRSRNLGSGLLSKGVKPKDFVGIFASNCTGWVLAEQACNSYSIVTVPLYDTLGDEAIVHILNQAELAVVVCDASKVSVLMSKRPEAPKLRMIVSITKPTVEQLDKARELGLELVFMDDLEAAGEADLKDDIPPTPEDVATVCYTSGTTGAPKGALLTHGNMIADLSGLIVNCEETMKWDSSMTHISYLPLAHMFERLTQALVFTYGGRIGFFRGDIKLLMDDLVVLRPTIFPSVPRLLNRIYDKVLDGVNQAGGIKRALFNYALKAKRKEVAAGIVRNDSVWDKLVFSKVQARLGGRVNMVVTGAAPISDDVLDFLRCSMGCHVLQGYGQTESSAGSNMTVVGDPNNGHVGPPLCCNEIKLVSVPELGYLAEEGRGEVCFRGYNVFKGYLKNEEKTKETIDEDGWLHSGDVGRWNPDGTLSIIDRKKQIFKLAQGEYVAPEKVEMAYQCAPLVGQVFLHGDSLQAACVAVIVPDEVTLPRWAKDKGIAGTLEELCANEEANKAVLAQITDFGKKSGLKSFEQAKALHLHPTPFGVDQNLLTPTFKLKRPQLQNFFEQQINSMYTKLQ